ncbi:MAG: hypothetical protein CMC04_04580 [Flavobacteriaceae bacterium]|jgi:hypothetical protein|nr:hypothetical protein [Flavobacteriaceae bacterium]|tara:strand:- start:490 stop:714 length:225 start_codon:yes stop_codon:yes gene_type:complete
MKILYLILFIFLTFLNYNGAVGRIERKQSNLGPVSSKEEKALLEGSHKKLALKQAVIGSLIYTLIFFLIIRFIF